MPKIDPTTKLADSIQTLARASLSHADQMLAQKRHIAELTETLNTLAKRVTALEAHENARKFYEVSEKLPSFEDLRVSGDFVLIYGNPVDGCELYGPYTSHEAACEEGERLQGDWWVDRINPPTTKARETGRLKDTPPVPGIYPSWESWLGYVKTLPPGSLTTVPDMSKYTTERR